MSNPTVINCAAGMIIGRVQNPWGVLIAVERNCDSSTRKSFNKYTAANLTKGRHRRILSIGIDELAKCVPLVRNSAGVRPCDLNPLPRRYLAKRGVLVHVGVLPVERLRHIQV